jgi:citrate synthase
MPDDVARLIASVLQLPVDRIGDELSFQSVPEWDSLRHVDLMLALEDACGLEIDAEAMVTLDTVAKIRAFVRRHPPALSPPATAPPD